MQDSIVAECKNICFEVEAKEQKNKILAEISFDIERFNILAIVGKSGSGKTTLGKILAGILKPSEGSIFYNFQHEHKSGRNVQFLFQNSTEIINPNRKVKDVLVESLKLHSPNNIAERLEDLIKELKLSYEINDQFGYQLSGGERQRIALGRILAVNPELLILDEPFSAQDIESQLNLRKILTHLRKSNQYTIIIISHNLYLIKKIADEILVLNKGQIVEQGNSESIFNNPKEDYTKFLIHAAKLELTEDELMLVDG